jgi:hypothetical protein
VPYCTASELRRLNARSAAPTMATAAGPCPTGGLKVIVLRLCGRAKNRQQFEHAWTDTTERGRRDFPVRWRKLLNGSRLRPLIASYYAPGGKKMRAPVIAAAGGRARGPGTSDTGGSRTKLAVATPYGPQRSISASRTLLTTSQRNIRCGILGV